MRSVVTSVRSRLPIIVMAMGMTISVTAADKIDFKKDIQPILKRNCDRCHGATKAEADLNLATFDGLRGSSADLIVPGDPDGSTLMHRIADSAYGDLMPLDGERLSAGDIDRIQRWIDQGADVPSSWGDASHWAYTAPVRPKTPIRSPSSGRNPIDGFIADPLNAQGLQPSPPAAAATLARRASLALTGLPATPEQLDSLTNDPSDRNYESLVDHWLASPDFGQHWARHWLDLARYADSNGYQADQLRDSWAYRDWVVDAINQDMPFDQFVIHQLAGDLIPQPTDASRIATGFHRTPTCNVEAGVHPEANRVEQVFDRVNTTATVFLGSTLECAQCHDHKYDPFTQDDYYRLFAYFNNTPIEVKQDSGVQFNFIGPMMNLPHPPEQASRIEQLQSRLNQLRVRRANLALDDDVDEWIASMRAALSRGRAQWITPKPIFGSNDNASYQILDDHSVLLEGRSPSSAIDRFQYDDLEGPVLGVRVDAMRHDSLPGGGPGLGDAVRTNFVLHEVDAAVHTSEGVHAVMLGQATASFEQANYNVAGAVDGDPKTGWAIAPKFTEAHWAEFRATEPATITKGDKLIITLDQHFGRGRVMGRPKLSLLVGPPETADLSDEMVRWLTQDAPLKPHQRRKLAEFRRRQNESFNQIDREMQSIQTKLAQLDPPTTLVMVEQDGPRDTFVMERGDYLSPGERVFPGTPAALHDADETLPQNRLGLARWLVDADNPLLARVTVNRWWAEIFGRGIVATPEDFGTQSESPTHPELLDWLAVEFREGEWSMKRLIKTMVMSSTFRQSSRVTASAIRLDPDNQYLSRGPRYRLPAESVRDNALAISGLLSPVAGGPPIMPYQPDGIWRAVGRNQPKWRANADSQRYRRGLYVVWKRGAPYPSFVSFDAPDRASCTVQRPRTNTPLQALVLLNDHAYAEAAVGLAQRMLRECASSDPRDIARYGYQLATGQRASDEALDVMMTLLDDELQRMESDPDLASQRGSVLPARFRDPTADPVDVGAWFAVASVLLNLDATITMN